MKKIVLVFVSCILWAFTLQAAGLPPYGDTWTGPFYSYFSDQTDKGVELYPNPVTEGRLTIKSDESFVSVQILNITGEVVYNREFPSGSNSEVIELPKLEKGIYLVRIGFSGKPNYTTKIIVK